MGTVIRAQISEKNKYWIDKHRYYELKHFCLQYKDWKRAYAMYNETLVGSPTLREYIDENVKIDFTSKKAIEMATYSKRIKLIEQTTIEADPYLSDYILKGVTEGVSYTYLKTKLEIPCGRDMYYDRYRRFFWLLSKSRD